MSDSTTIKPFITNKDSKLVSLEMELKATCYNYALRDYTGEDDRRQMEQYVKQISNQIMELTILGAECE